MPSPAKRTIIIRTPGKITVWSNNVSKEDSGTTRKLPSNVANRILDTLSTIPNINNVLYINEDINNAIARCAIMQSNISFIALQEEMKKYTEPYNFK